MASSRPPGRNWLTRFTPLPTTSTKPTPKNTSHISTSKYINMKKIININFHSRVIPIEESAYEILQEYIGSLRRHFANEEGRDEIISDIENRFVELFHETLKKGAACITDDDVNAFTASMGRPEEFEGEEAEAAPKSTGSA